MHMANESDWYPVDKGQTLGTVGSESGIILADDEHIQGARITLEQCSYTPFAITCGIYGWMVHTAFASSKKEAQEQFISMKEELEKILRIVPLVDDPELEAASERVYIALRAFTEKF
jgi:hypothetical protein